MNIICETCGGTDWTIKLQRVGLWVGSNVYTMLKCNKCGMAYPVCEIVKGSASSVDHSLGDLKEHLQFGDSKSKALSLEKLPSVDSKSVKILKKMGVSSLVELANENAIELSKILDRPVEETQKWIDFAKTVIGTPQNEKEQTKVD